MKNLDGAHLLLSADNPDTCAGKSIVPGSLSRHNHCAVYALGLYVDKDATQKVLTSKFPGADTKALASSQKLCDGKLCVLLL